MAVALVSASQYAAIVEIFLDRYISFTSDHFILVLGVGIHSDTHIRSNPLDKCLPNFQISIVSITSISRGFFSEKSSCSGNTKPSITILFAINGKSNCLMLCPQNFRRFPSLFIRFLNSDNISNSSSQAKDFVSNSAHTKYQTEIQHILENSACRLDFSRYKPRGVSESFISPQYFSAQTLASGDFINSSWERKRGVVSISNRSVFLGIILKGEE